MAVVTVQCGPWGGSLSSGGRTNTVERSVCCIYTWKGQDPRQAALCTTYTKYELGYLLYFMSSIHTLGRFALKCTVARFAMKSILKLLAKIREFATIVWPTSVYIHGLYNIFRILKIMKLDHVPASNYLILSQWSNPFYETLNVNLQHLFSK